ncbi:hypothetical protein DBP19_02730 [Streptomyces sp. CS090A]|nr:hypothetical protein DBP19_02730 [Streptomyces sp. CS090A]
MAAARPARHRPAEGSSERTNGGAGKGVPGTRPRPEPRTAQDPSGWPGFSSYVDVPASSSGSSVFRWAGAKARSTW